MSAATNLFETELHRCLVRCDGYGELQMWDGVLKELESLDKVWRSDLRVMAWKLEAWFQLGDGSQTRRACAEVLAEYPRNAAAVVLVTECFIRCHKAGRGPEQYNSSQKREVGMLWLDLALTRAFSGHVTGARRALDNYVRWPFAPAGK